MLRSARYLTVRRKAQVETRISVHSGTPRVNYLAFPLFYVYYKDTAVEDTSYSLQTLVGIVPPVYPLDKDATSALRVVESISNAAARCALFETKPIPNESIVLL